jgi:hypothetical protein
MTCTQLLTIGNSTMIVFGVAYSTFLHSPSCLILEIQGPRNDYENCPNSMKVVWESKDGFWGGGGGGGGGGDWEWP